MRFARQFGAVLVVVAAVTALGVAWGHSGAAGWITPRGGAFTSRVRLHGPAIKGHGVVVLPPGAHRPRGALRARVIQEHVDAAGFHLSDIGSLTSTAEIALAAMAGTIMLEIGWRRAWRARRRAARAARALTATPPAAGEAE